MREQQLAAPFAFTYQSAALFLVIMSAPFLLPHAIWHTTTTHSGVRIANLIEKVNIDDEASIGRFVRHIHNTQKFYCRLYRRRLLQQFCCSPLLMAPIGGAYNTSVFLLCQLLNVANVFLQFHIINSVILTRSITPTSLFESFASGDAIVDIVNLNVSRFQHSNTFPLEVGCQIQMRETLGSMQLYQFVCLLPINVLNQRVFILLYVWLLLLLLVHTVERRRLGKIPFMRVCSTKRATMIAMPITILGVVYASIMLLHTTARRWFVVQLLEASDAPYDPIGDHSRLDRFLTGFLCADGVLALRLLVARHGVMAGAVVAGRLWTREGAIHTSKSNGEVRRLDVAGLKQLNKSYNEDTNVIHKNKNAADSAICSSMLRADSTYGTFYKPCESTLHKRMIEYLEHDREQRRGDEAREASVSSTSS